VQWLGPSLFVSLSFWQTTHLASNSFFFIQSLPGRQWSTWVSDQQPLRRHRRTCILRLVVHDTAARPILFRNQRNTRETKGSFIPPLPWRVLRLYKEGRRSYVTFAISNQSALNPCFRVSRSSGSFVRYCRMFWMRLPQTPWYELFYN